MRSRILGVIVSVAMVFGLGVSMAAPASANTGKLWYQMGVAGYDVLAAWNNPQATLPYAQPADDFAVDVAWKINEIQVMGYADAYPGLPVQPTSANIYIYWDGGEVPGNVHDELDNVPVTIVGATLTMHTRTIFLTKGTYWLSVVPNLTDPNTYWWWSRNASPTVQGTFLPAWRGFDDYCYGSGQDFAPFIYGPQCWAYYPNSGLKFAIYGSGN